ncbi:MAG TPA: hypothetical protein VMY77_15045 [Chitinophagaceae bacterium]|nr:hypothetical protein [Chitinophagaceae bacterium]
MKRDSFRIDSLIKKIPAVKDTARINYLNSLTRTILFSAYPQKTKADRALPYVQMAYREAKLAGYQIGIAKSLMLLCGITTNNFRYNRRNNLDNTETLNKNEAYINELLEIAIKINDAEILGDAYEEESSFWFRKKNNQKIIEANKKAIFWYKKSGNETAECATNYTIASIYLETGEFESAFDYCKRALELAKKLSAKPGPDSINYVWLQLSWIKMSDLYKAAGDYQSAMILLQEGRQFHITQKSTYTWGMEMELADLFLYTGQYDSTIQYLMPIKNQKFSYQWPILGMHILN